MLDVNGTLKLNSVLYENETLVWNDDLNNPQTPYYIKTEKAFINQLFLVFKTAGLDVVKVVIVKFNRYVKATRLPYHHAKTDNSAIVSTYITTLNETKVGPFTNASEDQIATGVEESVKYRVDKAVKELADQNLLDEPESDVIKVEVNSTIYNKPTTTIKPKQSGIEITMIIIASVVAFVGVLLIIAFFGVKRFWKGRDNRSAQTSFASGSDVEQKPNYPNYDLSMVHPVFTVPIPDDNVTPVDYETMLQLDKQEELPVEFQINLSSLFRLVNWHFYFLFFFVQINFEFIFSLTKKKTTMT